MVLTYRIATLGCKVNQQESEALGARFEALGFFRAGRGEAADVCVVNSCTVTSAADSKTRQRIRQARAGNPGALVCVIGCMPEIRREAVLSMPEVDLAFGSIDKERTPELVMEALAARRGTPAAAAPAGGVEASRNGYCGAGGRRNAAERTRAFIKAEDGCDRFCAYCIIPYARGAVRSRPAEDVLFEAEAALDAGYKELVLTGVNLALYGRDAGGGLVDLYSLIEKMCSIGAGGEYRVRLGSLEPTVIDAGEAVRIAGISGVCPQFHLSLQSGAARTLAAMGRAYTPEEYMGIALALREIDPLFSLTTDVIVGFPGETDEDFAESVCFVKQAGFARVHVFKYSKRPGTRAAGMEGQAPDAVKNERSRLMIQAADEGASRFLSLNEGMVRRTLVFGPDKSGEGMRGLTDNGIDIILPAGGYESNTFADIKL